jgi:CDP-diacylglycerol--glycerol-3-phosphate 3-phosphatidyltransferase
MHTIKLTTADVLTLIRLFLSPTIIPLLILNIVPTHCFYANMLVGTIFLLFGLTDFLDGYLARNYYGTSIFGAIIDPVADKILMLSGFLSLLAIQKISVIWVLFFIARETIVMTIRYFALEKKYQVDVSFLGKIKTVLQILLVTVAIINPDQELGLLNSWWNILEKGLLASALFFSLYSLFKYYKVVHRDFFGTIPSK